jgi:hypothetical protein
MDSYQMQPPENRLHGNNDQLPITNYEWLDGAYPGAPEKCPAAYWSFVISHL